MSKKNWSIREEESHLGEDIGEGLSAKDKVSSALLHLRSQMDALFYSRPMLPSSPLGNKSVFRSLQWCEFLFIIFKYHTYLLDRSLFAKSSSVFVNSPIYVVLSNHGWKKEKSCCACIHVHTYVAPLDLDPLFFCMKRRRLWVAFTLSLDRSLEKSTAQTFEFFRGIQVCQTTY